MKKVIVLILLSQVSLSFSQEDHFFEAIWRGDLAEIKDFLEHHPIPKNSHKVRFQYCELFSEEKTETEKPLNDSDLHHHEHHDDQKKTIKIFNNLPKTVRCTINGRPQFFAPGISKLVALENAMHIGMSVECMYEDQTFETTVHEEYFTVSKNLQMGQKCAGYGNPDAPEAYIIDKHGKIGFWGGGGSCPAHYNNAHQHITIVNTLPHEVTCALAHGDTLHIPAKDTKVIATSINEKAVHLACTYQDQNFDTLLYQTGFTVSTNLQMGQECAGYGNPDAPETYIIAGRHGEVGFWGGGGSCKEVRIPEKSCTADFSAINYALLAYYTSPHMSQDRYHIIEELFKHHAPLYGESLLRTFLYRLSYGAKNICSKITCGTLGPSDFLEVLKKLFHDREDRYLALDHLIEQVRAHRHEA